MIQFGTCRDWARGFGPGLGPSACDAGARRMLCTYCAIFAFFATGRAVSCDGLVWGGMAWHGMAAGF